MIGHGRQESVIQRRKHFILCTITIVVNDMGVGKEWMVTIIIVWRQIMLKKRERKYVDEEKV